MDWSEAANIAAAVGLLGMAIGLFMTALQIGKAGKSSRSHFIHDLEGDAQRFQPLFGYLLPIGQPANGDLRDARHEEELLIFSALNFFEKVQILLQNKSVDMKSIDGLFAGRFFLITHSPLVQSLFLLNESYADYFSQVKELYRKWCLYRKNEGLPVLLENNIIKDFLKKKG